MSKFFIAYIIMSQLLKIWLEKERGQTLQQFMRQAERAKVGVKKPKVLQVK